MKLLQIKDQMLVTWIKLNMFVSLCYDYKHDKTELSIDAKKDILQVMMTKVLFSIYIYISLYMPKTKIVKVRRCVKLIKNNADIWATGDNESMIDYGSLRTSSSDSIPSNVPQNDSGKNAAQTTLPVDKDIFDDQSSRRYPLDHEISQPI